jgi:D-alanyl-D-alanine carboxypeptidase (penicillin-binding protein 5/6)
VSRPLLLLAGWLLAALGATAAPVPAPPEIAASGYLLVDFDSGRVLAARNDGQRLEPASLTKIMTAYVVFRELRNGAVGLDDQVLVSEKAWRTPGSRMFIEVNTRVSVEQLLRGMIVQSGNDASVALAEHVAGSESAFANLMNDHAARLGMRDSNFVNATGLPDPDHYTTPHDIAIVTRAMIREFPDYYRMYSELEYSYNDIRQQNRNVLLTRGEGVDGVKTGHTEAAGYCLVTSAKRDAMRLVSVVMGTASEQARADASLALLNYGFRFYETHRLYAAGDHLTRARVWLGDREQAALGLDADLFVTIPRHSYDRLDARTEIRGRLRAPVERGTEVGEVVVELDGDVVGRQPLVALEPVTEGGLWRKAVDSVLMLLD